MRVAVITPYYREPLPVLKRCHDSVLAQRHPCTHFMVADGHPRRPVAAWNVRHIVLPMAHADSGDTPRAIGGISALNLGFEAFCWLDADNWYDPDHVSSAVETQRRTGASAVFANRRIVLPDGTPVGDEDEPPDAHVDTNCMFLMAEAAFLLPLWGMIDQSLAPIGDRVMYGLMKARTRRAWTGRTTVTYESRYAVHYARVGRPPPPDVHPLDWRGMAGRFSQERQDQRFGFHLPIKL